MVVMTELKSNSRTHSNGLGNVGELVEARGKHRTARGRMGQGEDDWSDLGV